MIRTKIPLSKQMYLERCEAIWNRRDVESNKKLVLSIIHQRFCAHCHTPFSPKDSRILCCSRLCGQHRRSLFVQLKKDPAFEEKGL